MATRSGIQLAYPFSEKRLLTWHPPYLVQPKLNGERCRALVTPEGRVLLLSSSEEIINSVPHINKAMLSLPPGEYDGELYYHGSTWADVHSIVGRTTTLNPNHERMEFHIFDLVEGGKSQAERTSDLMLLRHSFRCPLHLVHGFIAWNHSELLSRYDQFISEGYEGFIVRELNAPYVRKRSLNMMKFKPKATDHYFIINFIEATDEDGVPKGMLGAFECLDDMHTHFKVGAGKLSHDKRKELWQRFIEGEFTHQLSYPHTEVGLMLEVEYQTMSDKNKVPLFSRAVRLLY